MKKNTKKMKEKLINFVRNKQIKQFVYNNYNNKNNITD